MSLKKVNRLTLALLLVAALLFSSHAIAATTSAPSILIEVSGARPTVEFISDVVYSQPATFGTPCRALRMDILKPASKDPLPAVLYIPGGGFMSANNDQWIQHRLDIAEAGYVVASIEYRVTPQSTFPAPLEDVKAAIRFLRANAEMYGIDPDRIAVMGMSAGGYLAALAGTTNGVQEFDKGDYLDQSSDVQAVIDIFGLSDLTSIGHGFPKEVVAMHASPSAPEALLVHGPSVFGPGGTIFDNPEKVARANPITYITGDEPPFLIFHGDMDTLVSPYQTEILHSALVKAGVDSTRYVVKGAGHGGPAWVQKQVIEIILNFLSKHLKKSQTPA
ncbi:MAG: alpha/beta hydrolase fold domain-containing protein [Moorellales bacterium]